MYGCVAKRFVKTFLEREEASFLGGSTKYQKNAAEKFRILQASNSWQRASPVEFEAD